MGEEENKPEEKKSEKSDKAEEEASKAEKPAEDGKKEEEKKPEESKENPPPPRDIVLKVYMHCEGCARKVRRCLKGFQGVEDVVTDCRTSKVVVKGEKADPLKVLERIQRKSHRQVELISPIPKPRPEDQPNKPEEKPVAKVEEKKDELPVITVVLKIFMHCEACAQEIKKRIQRMKGVESVEPDLKDSQVTVKGTFPAEKLADYVYRRTGKHATIVKVEPEKKEEEEKGKEAKEEKKEEEEKGKEGSKSEESGEEAQGGAAAVEPPAAPEDPKLEIKRNDYYHPYYYPQYHQQVNNNHPQGLVQEYYYENPRIVSPQMFSDENPNACSVM